MPCPAQKAQGRTRRSCCRRHQDKATPGTPAAGTAVAGQQRRGCDRGRGTTSHSMQACRCTHQATGRPCAGSLCLRWRPLPGVGGWVGGPASCLLCQRVSGWGSEAAAMRHMQRRTDVEPTHQHQSSRRRHVRPAQQKQQPAAGKAPCRQGETRAGASVARGNNAARPPSISAQAAGYAHHTAHNALHQQGGIIHDPASAPHRELCAPASRCRGALRRRPAGVPRASAASVACALGRHAGRCMWALVLARQRSSTAHAATHSQPAATPEDTHPPFHRTAAAPTSARASKGSCTFINTRIRRWPLPGFQQGPQAAAVGGRVLEA